MHSVSYEFFTLVNFIIYRFTLFGLQVIAFYKEPSQSIVPFDTRLVKWYYVLYHYWNNIICVTGSRKIGHSTYYSNDRYYTCGIIAGVPAEKP